jgi:hypothetical protein
MTTALHPEFYDPIARELAILAELVTAANATEHHLGQEAIDVALGLGQGLKLGA